jgi:hypothetical protein
MASTMDVSTMLGSLDSDPVGRFAETIALSSADSKMRDPLRKAFTLVQDHLQRKDRPLLSVEQAKIFERVAPNSFGLLRLDQPAFIETLLVAAHSRATELLRAHGARAALHDLNNLPARVEAALKSMAPEVLGEFITETAMSAARSREVSERLASSAEAIRRSVPHLSGLEAQAGTIYRKKQGGGECECIVSGCNGYGNCQNFCIDSWWVCFLIFIGIILIIILG